MNEFAMPRSAFSVDQTVTVVNFQGDPVKITKVKDLGKRKMILTDGSEWTADGDRQYGNSREKYYMGPSVRAVRDEDGDVIQARRYAHALGKIVWKEVSLAKLRAIHALLREEPKG